MKKLALLFVVLLSPAPSHAFCVLTREVLNRDDGATEWESFKPLTHQEITSDVYGVMNSFHHEKKVVDYFFFKPRCGATGVNTRVIYETNTIPLTANWKTIWERPYLFAYEKNYEWSHRLGTRTFLIRFRFEEMDELPPGTGVSPFPF
jgi:hypothetical protein